MQGAICGVPAPSSAPSHTLTVHSSHQVQATTTRCSYSSSIPDVPPSLSRRRAAAALLPAAALLAGAWPARAADSIGSSGAAAPAQAGPASSFYSQWPYLQPADILPFLRATATPGDIDSVLHAIDEFAAAYPMFRCGPEKGAILERLVAQQQPGLALELGTFMGYGTMRIWRQLPPGGRVLSIEAGEEQAAVAQQVLELAGVPVGSGPEARVQVVNGLSGDVLPRLRQLAGLPEAAEGKPGAADFVFLDHCKPCYLPDLISMERLGLVGPGTLVVADNVLIPGAPDYLAHVRAPQALPGAVAGSSSPPSEPAPAARAAGGTLSYRTELVATQFEVEERYKQDWQPRTDAMSVSRCIAT